MGAVMALPPLAFVIQAYYNQDDTYVVKTTKGDFL